MPQIKTKRSETTLTKRLQKIAEDSASYISRDELRAWYDTKALRPGEDSVFSDVQRRWRELSGGKRGLLVSVPKRNGFMLFAMYDLTVLGTKTPLRPRGRVL